MSHSAKKWSEKRHDNVCRDIENLNLEYGKLSLLKVGETPYTHEQNGQTYYEYQLTKEQTIDLITGYRADLRIKINRRWQGLEQTNTPSPLRCGAPILHTASHCPWQCKALHS